MDRRVALGIAVLVGGLLGAVMGLFVAKWTTHGEESPSPKLDTKEAVSSKDIEKKATRAGPRTVLLQMNVEPESASASARIYIDNRRITGWSKSFVLGDGEELDVTLKVRAPGFHEHKQVIRMTDDKVVQIRLTSNGE